MNELNKIVNLINEKNLIGNQGNIVFSYAGVSTVVTSKDIVGNTIQDWFGQWLTSQGILWNPGIHSQNWPDFILADDTHLELKTFDSSASPNFDLANFDAFIRSLWEGHVHRLDTPHLVFSYLSDSGSGLITIDNFWVEPMWKLTGPSETNFLSLQVKQQQPVNIRPKNWRNPRNVIFNSRREFVHQLNLAVQRYRSKEFPNWYSVVNQHYRDQFYSDL